MFGYLSNRLAAKYCTAISFFFGFFATITLITVNSQSSLIVIWSYALTMGLSIGGWAPLASALTSKNFGLVHYGAIYGALLLFFNLSTVISPILFGYVYDATQEYYWAFIASLAFYSTAIASILALQHPKLRSVSSDNRLVERLSSARTRF